jgi:hypothetical protein
VSIENISALATGVGTLILAVATFFATSSANRAARTAELAMQIGQRPLLMASKLSDERQKIMFADDHWVHVDGGGAGFEYANGVVYFVISVRNVGPGEAVMQGWLPHAERRNAAYPRADTSEFRAHTRDLYVPPGDIGLWQGALRDPDAGDQAPFVEAVQERRSISIDVLYSDAEGGQRTVTRFGLIPSDSGGWVASVVRHWRLDGTNPR